jgi:hypothetical protein
MENTLEKEKSFSPSWAGPGSQPSLIREINPASSSFSSMHHCQVGPGACAAHRSAGWPPLIYAGPPIGKFSPKSPARMCAVHHRESYRYHAVQSPSSPATAATEPPHLCTMPRAVLSPLTRSSYPLRCTSVPTATPLRCLGMSRSTISCACRACVT